MRIKILTIFGAFSLLASTPLMAAENFDIKVTGTITPAACKPTISGGETFDYGNILVSSLSKDDYTVLEAKSSPFSISCDAPVKLAFTTQDNRSASVSKPVGKTLLNLTVNQSTSVMGLGQDGKGNNIGSFIARIFNDSVTLDTVDGAVSSLYSTNKGSSWISASTGVTFANNTNIFSWTEANGTAPIAFSQLNGEISVQPAISPTNNLDLTQPVLLDGSATVTLIYL